MAKFLIDANLPYYFSLWHHEDFSHLKDLSDTWSDHEVWEYAKKNNLTIITKDADFSNRIIVSDPPPRIIHLRMGNLKMANFHEFLERNWTRIKELNQTHKLVNVFIDRIEGIQ